ncbi:MAG: mechanosensitive ion channel [Gemmatimonadetes bacterium]|nr:mechanosensitive ion channel [Gemmatimonadota bacterium]
MQEFWNEIQGAMGGSLLSILQALGILLVGWLIATVVAKGVRAALRRTRLDDRVVALFKGESEQKSMDVGGWISQGVFYVLMLMVVIAVCQALNLTLVTEPLSSLLVQLFAFLPNIIATAVLLFLAWLIATVMRRIVTGSLRAMRLDDRVAGDSVQNPTLANSIGEAIYWFVFLLFLPAILGTLQLEGILRPVQLMFDNILGYLPKLVAAGLIGLIGWFVAGIVRRIVTNLLGAAGVDRLGNKIGLASAAEKRSISGALGLVVYIVILVPVLISALNSLQLYTITEPATAMLYVAFDAVPMVLAASVILLLAFFIGRLLSGVTRNLLEAVNFDAMLVRIGLLKEGRTGRSIASILGTLVLVAVMFFAVIEAADLLGFAMISEMAAEFLVFASQILAGVLILAVGFYLASLAANAIKASNTAQPELLARTAWIAIMLLSTAIGLRRMGLANDIINMAFGLLIGAVAVATAIAFGIGGREVAGRALQGWLDSSKRQ